MALKSKNDTIQSNAINKAHDIVNQLEQTKKKDFSTLPKKTKPVACRLNNETVAALENIASECKTDVSCILKYIITTFIDDVQKGKIDTSELIKYLAKYK